MPRVIGANREVVNRAPVRGPVIRFGRAPGDRLLHTIEVR
jgi:hypothetical protein